MCASTALQHVPGRNETKTPLHRRGCQEDCRASGLFSRGCGPSMISLTESPFLMFGVSLVALCACTWTGAEVLGRYAARGHEAQEDFRTVLAACLTLLGLIIGFSFSMAMSRYDLRKGYEAAEASAISTEFVRA